MENEKKIVAKVEDKEITYDQVVEFIKGMGPEMARNFQSEEGIKNVIAEMVNQELLYLDALEKDMDKEQEFVDALEAMKENLLKSYAFSKVVSNIDVTDEDAKDFYENVKDSFKEPNSVDASHILVASEEEAIEVKNRIDKGESFEDIAKEVSTCPSKENGGNLGTFYPGQMVPEFDEKAFSMEVGEISEPVKTQFGYHIIKLTKKTPESTKTFDEVKENCKMEALRLKQQQRYLDVLTDLKAKYNVSIF